MIRIKPTTGPMIVDEEDEDSSKEIKEQGFRLGAKGNQSETIFFEKLRKIVSVENALEKEYEEAMKRTPKTGMSEIEDILWKQIDIERNKVQVYEPAYMQEKFLRLRAVNELRKHEERMFGDLTDIPDGIKQGESILTDPNTPRVESTRSDEDAPWYWR